MVLIVHERWRPSGLTNVATLPTFMTLSDALLLLERCFTGLAEGAPRLREQEDARFALRPSAVWLEYRWYVQERGMAEVFLKWPRTSTGQSAAAEATVLRVHLLGVSPTLSQRAGQLLVGGTPSRDRIMDLFGDDGVRRECVCLGRTNVTVEHWEPQPGPRPLLDDARFTSLAEVLEAPDSTPEVRHEAVQRLADERSPRVVAVLLALVARKHSLMALRVLSEWGVVGAREALQRDLAQVRPDNPADLWTLTALERRLQAWAALQ
ncbi:hypothetical protein MXAN_5329 [Myxococcus xanthus DK 1622]|uniref:Uncharacterized protein n=1 Tax=Myxococcus xanthus (strain DK1622) TaxID=246197 RepID=Q1D1J4_MYXXD|nr:MULTISPECIES: hypothetical protein [Myxococcus]ABF90519.1 hypothetical protein MXAN_5329 [Myxococcus xanthus DK 1622]NOJ54723.1 hypothetical protein [Myxococcus xanthus]QPM77802.1 hypothetical protein I5Q59_26335 [Myxococcus xanthus]QVW66870.1 hypothetical protein JTM82_31685 [Myxococcus xanthus DZ2]QZZ52985.1 hypothetical protein MyxoNM_27605 [Myxococcus xanthus]